MPVKATYLAIAGGGIILLWSGIRGKKWSDVLREIIANKPPTSAANAYAITGTSPGSTTLLTQEVNTRKLPAGGTPSANELLGKSIAATFGWATGSDWQALNYGWGTLESGWNQYATNPSSGAFGIAQALGHGNASTRGKYSDMYGPVSGMSLPNSVYVAANNGSAGAQILWGLTYIKITYGRPANVPGWLGQGGYSGY